MNLFKQHRKVIASEAEKTAKQTTKKQSHDIGTDELLNADLARIKQTERSQRDTLKKQLIKKYQDAFKLACKLDEWCGNRLIFWNIIWLFDVDNIKEAFNLSKLGFDKGLTSDPKVFKSTFATVVADTIFKWADAQYKAEATTSPVLDEMIELLKNGLDINPIPHAKLLKLHGDIIRANDPKTALAHFIRAQELDETIGVKTRINELSKETT